MSLPARGLYDYTVAIDGTGDFTSIQAAIDACRSFPDKRIRVFIKNGTYREKIKRLVEADDFHAGNLTVDNSAGRVGQAVALHVVYQG